jgi:hypothetical protein
VPLFSTVFTPPPQLTGLEVNAGEAASVVLTWDPSTITPGDFVAYNVYRSAGGATFVLLAALPNQSDTTYTDHAAPIGVGLTYRVTQVSLDDESAPAEGSIELDQCEWWLVTPGAATASFELPNVTEYESSWPMQSEAYEPLGRRFKLVESGLVLGEQGALGMLLLPEQAAVVTQLRSALAGAAERLLLKSPHGEVIEVKLGSLSRTRQAQGRQEVALTFTQVA